MPHRRERGSWKENLRLAKEAERQVLTYLQKSRQYTAIIDFTYPEPLTKWITETVDKLRDYSVLKHFNALNGTKYDFMARYRDDVVFIDAKGKSSNKWLHWGCGTTTKLYDRYFDLSRLAPFHIIIWVKNTNKLYRHVVRNPKRLPYEILENCWSDYAYRIPRDEVEELRE